MVLSGRILAGELAEVSTSPASQPDKSNTPVYVVLWGGTLISSIDLTTNGTLLAFAQVGGGHNHPNNVHLRRSTDGGKTWNASVYLGRTS